MVSCDCDCAHMISIVCTVPAPSVVIEEVGMPFNGTEFILSCIVGVDNSVDTDINISSQWLTNAATVMTGDTISENSEGMDIVHRHNLTFSPLRSHDQGMYTCTAAVSATEENKFIRGTSSDTTTTVTVKSEYNSYV